MYCNYTNASILFRLLERCHVIICFQVLFNSVWSPFEIFSPRENQKDCLSNLKILSRAVAILN